MDGAEFLRRKGIGTTAETALMELLASAGGTVTLNQQNRDFVENHPGAAVAHAAGAKLHLPDLSVLWPTHPIRRFHLEAKAKSPLARGGWGWDVRAFDRAVRWSELCGDPVFYCIRDISRVPLPLPGEADSPNHWHIASVWKLVHSPSLYTEGNYYYWPEDEFLPLAVLYEQQAIISASVPYLPAPAGPPIVL